jgi:hypothetical protein
MSQVGWGITDETYVFADEAGKYEDDKQDVLLLSTLIIHPNEIPIVKSRQQHVKERCFKYGVDTNCQEFEFHSYELFFRKPKSLFRNLSLEQRESIAAEMQKIFIESRISFIVVKLDKTLAGKEELGRFAKFIEENTEEILTNFTPEEIASTQTQLDRLQFENEDHGPLFGLVNILFGMTSSLLHLNGYKGQAKTITDDQFLQGFADWQRLFRLFKEIWGQISNSINWPTWPQGAHPTWHLGSSVSQDSSTKHFGLQLADFLSYTAKRLVKGKDDLPARYSIVREDDFKQFLDYKGISMAVSSNNGSQNYGRNRTFRSLKSERHFVFNRT